MLLFDCIVYYDTILFYSIVYYMILYYIILLYHTEAYDDLDCTERAAELADCPELLRLLRQNDVCIHIYIYMHMYMYI